MQCLILAGGLGTRVRPITEQIPKAMIEVAGYPFVHHQLKLLKKMGINDVIFSIGYLGNMISDYVENGSNYEINIRYVNEGKNLLGTAGAIRLAIDCGQINDGFLVLYGDSYLPIELEPIWEASNYGKIPTMTILKNNGQWDKSNVYFKNNKMFYDKFNKNPEMNYIDYGLSILTKDVILSNVPINTVMDLATIFHNLSIEGNLKGYEVHQRFYECGSFEGIKDLEEYLQREEI